MKLNVTTHSGGDDVVEVTTYDADKLAEKINNRETEAVVIGNNVYSRIDIKNVKPV